MTRAGPPLIVKSLSLQRRAGGYTVYNLEVKGTHSYFVGTTDGGTWVHNYVTVGTAEGALKQGAEQVHVSNRAAAEYLMRGYIGGKDGGGYLNATGMDPGLRKVLYNTMDTANIYHWDAEIDANGQLAGHEDEPGHNWARHLQIHLESKDVIRIYFGPELPTGKK